MFCPKCKSIISKKRINNQIIEFCNCPDKLESNFVVSTEPVIRQHNKPVKSSSSNQMITIREKSKKKFTMIEESIVKEKRLPSDYTQIPFDLRLSNNARLPSFWKQNQVQKRLSRKTEELYEHYYRKIEDAFNGSELKFYLSFIPNESLSDFNVDYWGLGFKTSKIEIFYVGTKLNDLASWDSKVLEKESDVILPYRLFTNYYRKLNFDQLNLRKLNDILKDDWTKFKSQHQNLEFQPLTYSELYQSFKKLLFNKKVDQI